MMATEAISRNPAFINASSHLKSRKKCRGALKCKTWPFITKIPGDPYTVNCSTCGKNVNIKQRGLADIRLHIRSRLHKKLAAAGSVFQKEKMPITFHDVAIYFLEEEWKSLEEEQKELYKDIMMENHQTLLSLGYLRKKPKIISAIERGEEPYVKSDQNKKKLKNTVPGNKVVTSNNQEESLSSHCTTEDKNNLDSLTEQISRSPINTRKERNCISRSYGQSVISRRIHMYNVCVCL